MVMDIIMIGICIVTLTYKNTVLIRSTFLIYTDFSFLCELLANSLRIVGTQGSGG